jgi:YtcA family
MSVSGQTGSLKWQFVVFLMTPMLAGCSRAPSVDILGSFFPAWLVCFVVAIVLTAFVRLALLRLRMKVALPMLLYSGLTAVFTLVVWLIFYY